MVRFGNTGLFLCRPGDDLERVIVGVADLLWACRFDGPAHFELRRLLKLQTSASVELLDDWTVLENIAALVAKGRICIGRQPMPRYQGGTGGASSASQSLPAPFRPPPRRTPKSPEPVVPKEDPPVLPGRLDRVAFIAVMHEAAHAGVPFCDT